MTFGEKKSSSGKDPTQKCFVPPTRRGRADLEHVMPTYASIHLFFFRLYAAAAFTRRFTKGFGKRRWAERIQSSTGLTDWLAGWHDINNKNNKRR